MAQRCKVFTPTHIVNYMLDIVGYKKDLFGKRVLENSCGTGNILCAIVRRYIEASSALSPHEIKIGLERDIVGYDTDPDCCLAAKENLDRIAIEHGIDAVKWNIRCTDALSVKDNEQYDFIIGNPPYISYRSMDEEKRVSLRKSFSSCKVGAFDYCYAFIEHSLSSLKIGGRMIYLIPSSIFKNVHGDGLRQIMKKHLIEIHDYTSKNVFTEALTSSALAYFIKDSDSPSIKYLDLSENSSCTVDKTQLSDKWIFISDAYTHHDLLRFGDYFCASIVIATLLNSAFIISKYDDHDKNIHKDGMQIEPEATRNAVSPRLLRNGGKELIIFPYHYENGKLLHYEEKEFKHAFPLATQYLRSFKKQLVQRDADKNAKWFEYGRSQALKQINQDKLLLSTIVTGKVEVYSLQQTDVPYAGIMITRKGTTSLAVAQKLLQSPEFLSYVKAIGTYANGHSLRITPADVNNFMFPASLIEAMQ